MIAVKRISVDLVKILFPNWKDAVKVNINKFIKYCLSPAIEIRKIIKRQLGILDNEYKKLPDVKVYKKYLDIF